MTHADLELVSFRSPPVEEVALAAQFADPVISFEQLAKLGELLRAEFPVMQRHPALPRMTLRDEGFAIQFGPPVAMPRIWWVTGDGHFVVQAQEDRLVLNWRRLGKPTTYPRYPSLRQRFEALVGSVAAAVGTASQVDVCELTYVNELSPEGQDGSRPALASFLRTVARPQSEGFLPPPADERWAARWDVPLTGDGLLGGLDVKAEPAVSRSTERPLHLLTMTCRMGATDGVPISHVVRPLDIAHEWIVRGFADLTTPEMHERWGRTQ